MERLRALGRNFGVPAGLLLLALYATGLFENVFDTRTGRPAHDFSLPLVGAGAEDGDRLRLADLRGHVVVLDFWATWCPPCRRSIPILSRLSERFAARGLRVVGVNSEGFPSRTLRQYQGMLGAGFPSMQDDEATLERAYGVESLPTLVIIDKTGHVARIEVGLPDEDGLGHTLESLL